MVIVLEKIISGRILQRDKSLSYPSSYIPIE